jgi:hypothetical protein
VEPLLQLELEPQEQLELGRPEPEPLELERLGELRLVVRQLAQAQQGQRLQGAR